MKAENSAVEQFSIRGVFAPTFSALGIAAGVVDYPVDSPALVCLALLCLGLTLAFARDAGRLLSYSHPD